MLGKFIDVVTDGIQSRYPFARIEVHEVLKNNEVLYHGIHILEEDMQVCPNIYLENFYDMYKRGDLNLEEIVDAIADIHEEHKDEVKHMEIARLDFEDVKERIIFRLVNTRMNQSILKESPNVPYLDMSILFYLLVKQDEERIGSIRITYALMETWTKDVAIRELMKCALRNMPRLFPARVLPILSVIKGEVLDAMLFNFSVKEGLSYCGECGFHSLSNHMGINGAATILYPGILEEIASYFQSDLFVLPSSVHEVIILPDHNEYTLEELSVMVKEINTREVDTEEVLSNHAYYYNREQGKLCQHTNA